MSEKAIIISNLSRKYLINEYSKKRQLRNFKFRKNPKKYFYALQNINIEINKGELITIIGLNGAGKSTLLKLISEIILPSEGVIEINGKVASILELGVGFQPDLSGLDNIFLSGYMYGLRKSEIEENIENIIEMFGFRDFINTAVKYYSSGMYMRLAFSIITHINADIYLFDEIFSVGDKYFQNIALSKIKKLKEKGSTVCIISHSPNLLADISDKILLLNKAQQVFYGKPSKGLEEFQNLISYGENHMNKHEFSEVELSKMKILLVNNHDFSFDINYFKVFNSEINKCIFHHDFELFLECNICYKAEVPLSFLLLIKDIGQTIISSSNIELPLQTNLTQATIKFTIPPFSLFSASYIFEFNTLVKSEIVVIYPLITVVKMNDDFLDGKIGCVNLFIKSEIEINGSLN